jgi:hypothetical protein
MSQIEGRAEFAGVVPARTSSWQSSSWLAQAGPLMLQVPHHQMTLLHACAATRVQDVGELRMEVAMTPFTLSLIVLCWVFGGALIGMHLLGRYLPQDHLDDNAKDAIKVSMAMIATLAALVLGLLTASAKNALDDIEHHLRLAAAEVVLLDRTLAEYGPEADEVRDSLKRTVAARISEIWSEENAAIAPETIGLGHGIEAVQDKLLALSPRDDAQRWLQSTALDITRAISGARWQVFARMGSGVESRFLIVLVSWLALILSLIFASFGVFAPRNGTVTAALFAVSLSVSGSIYLILDMHQPHHGLIKISSAPLQSVMRQLGR